MIPAHLPPDEVARLLALAELNLLDTPADPVLDGLVRCAASMIGCPIALVSLVDRDRQWFKAGIGLNMTQTPREPAFCAHAILGDGLFEVPDAASDPRFADNPLVVGEPHVRFYAGAPLDIDGRKIGTLCVIDHQPRRLDAAQRSLLIDLARAVEHWIMSWREHHQLRETQGFVAKVARLVPGAFFQYRMAADGRSSFPYASDGLQAVYELPPYSVPGDATPVFERLHPDDRAGVHSAIERSASMLTPWYQQYRVQLPERGERWLESHATPERIDDGSVLWHGFVQDITARREFERLSCEKLASERASQAKSEFLARVSHELRTPLNAVLGFTQLMQADAQLTKRTQGHLQHVRDAGQHLLDLVDDILDLTRIEQGMHALRAEPVSVAGVLEASLALIEPLAKQRAIRVMPVCGGTNVVAHADARAIGQVLLNLLSNGVKYNPEQGRLWVEVRTVGAEVVVCVSDEGKGLSHAQRERLFRPFERLGAEDSKIQGSGLGLVISKQLVEAMHGRLEVHDRPEGGCRFEMWLPTLPSATRPNLPQAQQRSARDMGSDVGGPLVLCAEDDPVNTLLLQHLFKLKGGQRMLCAQDGEEALRLARQHRPELLISDTSMPVMDGLALVKAIRADPVLRSMRCIALSGDAATESRALALGSGYDEYWTKPLDFAVLQREIERLQAG